MAPGYSMRSLRDMGNPYQHAPDVSIVRTDTWVTLGKVGWISVADQKWGFEGVLWYQDMSRVCPGCPQTTPREAGKGGYIGNAYGEHRTLNLEPRTSNLEKPGQATQSHSGAKAEGRRMNAETNPKPHQIYTKATLMRPSSQVQARYRPSASQEQARSKPGTCEVHARYMRGAWEIQAW